MDDAPLSIQIHTLDLLLQSALDEALAGCGLTMAQWRLLDAALRAPGSSGAELARTCRVTAQTAQAIIATLERSGYLVRTPHPVHGRVLQVYVSNAGERRVNEGRVSIAGVEERLCAGFAPEEREQLARLVAMAIGGIS